MIADLKPYPEMKDCGVPWLGKVPAHWEVGTLRRRLSPYDGIKIGPFGSQLKLDQMLSSGFKVYGQANVIASDFTRGTKFVDEEKFKELSACEVQSGDLVVTMMGTSGRCARVPDTAEKGVMDSHLLRLRTNSSVVVMFAALILDRAPYVKEQIVVAGKGSIMHGLNSSMVKDLVLTFPPLAEQSAIVRYLDHAARRIRRYILAKQKLIKLLEEQKQAIIHRAVTRGLDPNVRLKPSGIPWLGDIPQHWEVRRLKSLVKESVAGPYGSSLTKSMYTKIGYRVYGQQQVISDDFAIGDYYISPDQFESMQRYQVFAGDLLVSVMGTIGKVAVVPDNADPGIINPRLVRYRPEMTAALPRWLQLVMQDGAAQAQLSEASKGTTMDGLNMRILGKLLLLKPPLVEQNTILEHVATERRPFTIAISRLEREIELLREYRTRLIADVVTGKLDVRAAAAKLPEEADEPEPLDEAAALVEGDEEIEDADLDAVPEETEA